MSFSIRPLQESDIPEFMAIDHDSTQGWGLAEAMHAGALEQGTSRAALIEMWVRAYFQKRQSEASSLEASSSSSEVAPADLSTQTHDALWIKAVDPQTGDMVAFACWSWDLIADGVESGISSAWRSGQTAAAVVAADEQAAAEGVANHQDAAKELGNKDAPPAPMLPVLQGMAPASKAFREKYIVGNKHYFLHVLVTDPAHQRRSAALQLVRWGTARADAAGALSALKSTQQGYGVYIKAGFEKVTDEDTDLSPYGVDKVEFRKGMVRVPGGGKGDL